MEAYEAKNLMGQEVWWERNKCMADIFGYEAGWVHIKTDDDKTHKVRAKELVLMNTDDEIVETEEGDIEVAPADPSEVSSDTATKATAVEEGMEINCECGHVFPAPKVECFRCPNCDKWHQVRLHPKLENYVKGLGETPSGRDTVDINDEVAEEFRGMTLEDLYQKLCDLLEKYDREAWFSKAMNKKFNESGMSCYDFLTDRYGNLNSGMQHMNIRNLLRGIKKRQAAIDLKKEIAKDGE